MCVIDMRNNKFDNIVCRCNVMCSFSIAQPDSTYNNSVYILAIFRLEIFVAYGGNGILLFNIYLQLLSALKFYSRVNRVFY